MSARISSRRSPRFDNRNHHQQLDGVNPSELAGGKRRARSLATRRVQLFACDSSFPSTRRMASVRFVICFFICVFPSYVLRLVTARLFGDRFRFHLQCALL